MTMSDTIVGQFRNPHGLLGSLAGWIMAKRSSNRQRNLWTVDLLNIQPQDHVLEIGCGPGIGLEASLAQINGGRVVGLDHSQTMLSQALARNEWASQNDLLHLQLGDLEGLEISEGSYDKIFSANVVQFFPDRTSAFRKIHMLLKPNGRAATTYMPRNKNPSKSDALKMADDIAAHMQIAGFVNIRIEELPLDPVPAICVLGEHS